MSHLNLEIRGQGNETLVFIHGFGGWAGIWQFQIEVLSSDYRCISVDLPGHGKSPWHPSTVDSLAGELLAALEDKTPDAFHCVASSFGGLIALKAWEARPDRVKSLFLAGSLPRFVRGDDFPAGLDQAKIAQLSRQLSDDVGKVLDMFFRSLTTISERENPQYVQVRALRRSAQIPKLEALQNVLELLAAGDLRDTLHRCDVPVRFLLGECDYICPPVVRDPLRRLCPQAKVTTLPQTGHFPFLTRPREFNAELLEFMYDHVS